ncbi:hypothetical protein CCH79_00004461 [Gambusia affinis]|uniref:Protein phosphatase 1 regulatory subunit 37 n=1 Tax=Gambusia affinis TaxID=33528 RepID=A0A315UZQ7_GAMAF|nr:hypothetical protein CCH79_00004461 [Gambusia affinis]
MKFTFLLAVGFVINTTSSQAGHGRRVTSIDGGSKLCEIHNSCSGVQCASLIKPPRWMEKAMQKESTEHFCLFLTPLPVSLSRVCVEEAALNVWISKGFPKSVLEGRPPACFSSLPGLTDLDQMMARERLDHRSCEALEVVLKSLHFDFINLQAAQLEENGASSLLDMILYYESTTYLDISDNGSMGTSSWRALAHLIKQSVCLSRLDACNVCLVGYPVQSLSKALLTSQLRELHLNNAQLSGSSLFTLVRALKTNRALLELHLSSNQLNGYQDAMQLGELLRYNNTLQTLELSDNVLGDPGLEELCDGLSRQTKGLKVLILKNNQITERGMNHLAKTLPGLKILEVLDLGDNHLGNEGIQVIREPLMVNSSLLHLGLAQSNITCEGAVALAEFLAESRLIQRLDLHQNRVKLGGLMALSLALRINCSLSHLGVDPIPPQELICLL